jgi:hypothetical protein
MKTALLVVGVIVLMAAAAVGGFYFGASSGGSINLPLVGNVSLGQNQTAQFQAGRFQSGQMPQGQFDPSQMTEEQRQQFQQARGNRQGGTPQAGARGAFGGGSFGTIESIENGIIVVKTQSATMKVKTTDTTLIEKQMSVGVAELKVGDQSSVSGSQGDDGVTTARSIRVLSAPPAGQ